MGVAVTVQARRSVGVEHPIRYSLDAPPELVDAAAGLADCYLDVIVDSIVTQPRSLQKRIGPSEMGDPCTRALLHKLAGDREPERSVPWKPTIGTAMHAYLEEAFTAASAPGQEQEGRWLTEVEVTVGTVGGVEVTGHTDLYDSWLKAVVDHKLIGKSTMKKYRAHGPGDQYRTQAHLYGLGHIRAGRPVKMVAIAFLPREGELTDTFIWAEPYNEAIALAAIARCDALANLLNTIGLDAALAMYPVCDNTWCRWCGTGSPFPPMPPATTVGELIGATT